MHRRTFLENQQGAVLAAGAASAASLSSVRAAATDYARMKLPPPIGREERLQRLASARAMMQRQGIGAIVIEPGASLDYFTGVQWWRLERLTAAVIPAEGDPIIVTPFFESPSVEESLKVPAEIRTWNEDEEPLKLVADFLAERKAAARRSVSRRPTASSSSIGSSSNCRSFAWSAPTRWCGPFECSSRRQSWR